MEPLERVMYYDEQDDYWLVMEMYQAYIEWLRYQRYGKIEEADEHEEEHVNEEAADQVLKLDIAQGKRSQKRTSKNGSK